MLKRKYPGKQKSEKKLKLDPFVNVVFVSKKYHPKNQSVLFLGDEKNGFWCLKQNLFDLLEIKNADIKFEYEIDELKKEFLNISKDPVEILSEYGIEKVLDYYKQSRKIKTEELKLQIWLIEQIILCKQILCI